MTSLTLERESDLYSLGPRYLETDEHLPHLPPDALAVLIRSIWDKAGFVGKNVGGYPVVSLVAPRTLAEDIATIIWRQTGRSSPARPLNGNYWVGTSGSTCFPWLHFLYDDARQVSPTRLQQAYLLLEEESKWLLQTT